MVAILVKKLSVEQLVERIRKGPVITKDRVLNESECLYVKYVGDPNNENSAVASQRP